MSKIKLTLFLSLFLLIPLIYGFIGNNGNFSFSDNNQNSVVFDNAVSKPDLEEWYFRRWYEPYGVFTPDMRNELARQIQNMPADVSINSWTLWGPIGQRIYPSTSTYYSGRILDIEVDGSPSTRLGTASGGLWGFVFIFPVSLSDNLTATLNIGSFDSQTGSGNTILVGTGEGAYSNGAGFFKTTDGGTTWVQKTMTPTPAGFFKLRYAPGSTTVVHAATSTGYYRSDDNGETWTRHQLTARVTDLAVDPTNTNVIYAPVWGDGLYKSLDGGNTWTKMTAGGIPTTNWGRSSISLCAGTPATVYVNVSKNSDDLTLGVYKTVNAGTTWSSISPAAEFHSYGWYNNACGVCPTNPNNIVVGGLGLWHSTNGGTSWTQITNAHADQHIVTWNAGGTSCWVGNDGGMFFSNDAGTTWDYNANFLPITQYVIFDVTPDGNYCYGGSQDNGLSGTSDRGSTWYHYLGGDGGGAAIDPTTHSKIAMTNGVYGGSWAFRRLLTTNNGTSWNFIDGAIDPSAEWYHHIRNDHVSPVYLYDHSGAYVWESLNYGTTWARLNATAFTSTISDISVSRYTAPKAAIYACLGTSTAGNKLKVYDNTGFFERSTGLPGNSVRHVTPHPTNNQYAYAVMNGFSAGQKIFMTTNRGTTWTNISGNIPDIPMAGIIPHPTDNNKMYLGTSMGCYKTTDGGVTWVRWNNGMPSAIQVTEMGYIDSIAANGRYYVVAATYGRSIYYREISGDDPIGITGNQGQLPKNYELSQNYPNPFNPTTNIHFALPVQDNVKLEVFDITGRKVATILDETMKAGNHTIKYDGLNLSSGVYFYKLTTNKFTETKKMLLVK